MELTFGDKGRICCSFFTIERSRLGYIVAVSFASFLFSSRYPFLCHDAKSTPLIRQFTIDARCLSSRNCLFCYLSVSFITLFSGFRSALGADGVVNYWVRVRIRTSSPPTSSSLTRFSVHKLLQLCYASADSSCPRHVWGAYSLTSYAAFFFFFFRSLVLRKEEPWRPARRARAQARRTRTHRHGV